MIKEFDEVFNDGKVFINTDQISHIKCVKTKSDSVIVEEIRVRSVITMADGQKFYSAQEAHDLSELYS